MFNFKEIENNKYYLKILVLKIQN